MFKAFGADTASNILLCIFESLGIVILLFFPFSFFSPVKL